MGEVVNARPFLRRALMPLAIIAAGAWSFGVFVSALGTNIYVDGHPDAGTWEVLLGVTPVVAMFFVPALLSVLVARTHKNGAARTAFGATSAISLPVLTFGWGAGALLLVALPWAACASLIRRRLVLPPLDVVGLVAGVLLFVFFAYSEAHR